MGLVGFHKTFLYQFHTTQEVGSQSHTLQVGAVNGAFSF